jgi:type II secretory pathway pseudopilin PulG
MNKNGFTLIETLIYIAIIGGVVATFVSFSMSITQSRDKTYVVQEVQANSRTALDYITKKIRMASSVNTSTSVFDTDPGYLSLAMTSSTLNPTNIGLSADDGVLQIREGGSASTTVTADELKISNLVFTDLTASSTRENVRVQMTTEFVSSDSADFDFSQSVQTSVSLRQ